MKTKLTPVLILCFLICLYAQAQDSTNKSKRVLYRIPVSGLTGAESLTKSKLIAQEARSIISCAINSITKEAVVSTKLSNGTETKEIFVIKEVNK